MAPSPSSSINTPGQAVAVPSPLNPHEEQQYREKYRQLTKYIDPLKRMVARIGNDGKDSSKESARSYKPAIRFENNFRFRWKAVENEQAAGDIVQPEPTHSARHFVEVWNCAREDGL